MPIPDLPPALPRHGGPVSRWFGRALVRLLGWDFEGTLPNVSKLVVIGAPHTSNWDFIVAMAIRLALGLDVRWIGKHTIFRPPFGRLMRWLGGIPVDRGERHGIVAQMVAVFEQHERLLVGLSPEGTRKRVETWRTGFYHIAYGAGVPIMPFYFDYARKRFGIADLFYPTGNVEADLLLLAEVYRNRTPKRPELFVLPQAAEP